MEFEVRIVATIESCYVSLPLLLIQTLHCTTSSLPPVLTLELSSSNRDDPCFVAWSGSASSSSAIEIAQQFADCINLPDRTVVQVRAVARLPKATLVTIEPDTEDDWEVLELNAEHAEAAILNQVRIVQESMRFPLWLHGHTVVTFHVVSTFPRKGAVQLVPGTEVAVAPKRRNKSGPLEQACVQPLSKEHAIPKALRVQGEDMRFIHRSIVKGEELGVALTSIAFIHPETAQHYSVDSLNVFYLEPRLSSKESINNQEEVSRRKKSGTDNRETRQAIVRLIFSDSIAKGHIMISKSLRLYLRAGLHSWVYIKHCSNMMKPDGQLVTICPCQLKNSNPEKNMDAMKNGVKAIDRHNNPMAKQIPSSNDSDIYMNVADSAIHKEVVTSLSHEKSTDANKDTGSHSVSSGLQCLLRAWFTAQVNAVSSNAGVDVNTMVLGNETLLHFQVKDKKLGTRISSRRQCLSSLSFNQGQIGERIIDVFFMLSVSGESLHGREMVAYEFILDSEKDWNYDLGCLEVLVKDLNLGDPVAFYCSSEKDYDRGLTSSISSLGWMATAASDVIHRLHLLLSSSSGKWFHKYNLSLPGHVLIYGPSGSGKTLLARAVAKSLEEDQNFLAHITFIDCSIHALEKATVIRQSLSRHLSEALDHAPSLIVLDELHSIISSSSDLDGSQPSMSVVALAEFLTNIIDEYEEKRKYSCGIGPVAFIACVPSLESIPQSLSSSGRFDFHVQLPAPAANERSAILKHEIQKRSLECSDDILLQVAAKCDGYDSYDLEILVDRTVHAAVGRFISPSATFKDQKKPALIEEDFSQAIDKFLPIAMRDITKSAVEGGRSGWDDVGGLTDIRNAITEMIELPSKFPNIFANAPLRLRSNVLLYGPPGCGKTHIVGAAAAACSLRFIPVKGPELLNKYIGASEQAVRDIFSKAAAAAPCLLFFDEFDSIAPKRGHDNTGVTDRVVNQFLTELDGVEVLTGVFVFAATSRPDLLDAALLRPGRLDRLLFCDFPSPRERLDILEVLSKKLPLAEDVDLDNIAYLTEGFSGADLQALLSDAQLGAVHEILESPDSNTSGKKPLITDSLIKSTAFRAKPSISDTEKQRLYGIYSQFLDSKKSVTAPSRESKGKRVTLA